MTSRIHFQKSVAGGLVENNADYGFNHLVVKKEDVDGRFMVEAALNSLEYLIDLTKNI